MLTATFCENKRKREPALKNSQFSFPPITELATLLGMDISEVYLRIRSLVFSIVCFKFCGFVSEFYRS